MEEQKYASHILDWFIVFVLFNAEIQHSISCILTLDSAGCSSCVNKVTAECTSLSRKEAMHSVLEMRWHWEIFQHF